jgi:hypothetical protein
MANGKVRALDDFAVSNGEDHSFRTVGPSLTRQEFAEECDINTIMKRYEGHGGLNGLGPDPNVVPRYVDFSEMPQDLMGFMQLQHDAEFAFMQLPAVVRREFDNDPILFCDFAADPANVDQMRSWGLAKPAEPVKDVPGSSQAPASKEAPAPAPAPPTHGST